MNQCGHSDCLLFFVKSPRAGQVKTRLGSRLGMNNARRLSMAFVLDTLDVLSALDLPIRIHYAPPSQRRSLICWLGRRGDFIPQEGLDLGRCMSRAFSQAFGLGYQRALLLGSDIPDIPKAHLERAFVELHSNDAVLNPTTDGGFCLIGFRSAAFSESLLDNLSWSHSLVLELTAARIRQVGKSLALLPVWSDVDTLEDLFAFWRRNRSGGLRSLRLLERPCFGRPRGSLP